MADGSPACGPVPVVLDTNIFVAAGFNPRSHSARILELVRAGALVLAWDRPTRDETRAVLQRIPRLDWSAVAPLFDAGRAIDGAAGHPAFVRIGDPADRKFAALALAAGAILVSSDRDLLSVREALPLRVAKPAEFLEALSAGGAAAGT